MELLYLTDAIILPEAGNTRGGLQNTITVITSVIAIAAILFSTFGRLLITKGTVITLIVIASIVTPIAVFSWIEVVKSINEEAAWYEKTYILLDGKASEGELKKLELYRSVASSTVRAGIPLSGTNYTLDGRVLQPHQTSTTPPPGTTLPASATLEAIVTLYEAATPNERQQILDRLTESAQNRKSSSQ